MSQNLGSGFRDPRGDRLTGEEDRPSHNGGITTDINEIERSNGDVPGMDSFDQRFCRHHPNLPLRG